LNLAFGYDHPEIIHFKNVEVGFLQLEVNSVFTEDLHDTVHLMMLFGVLREDEDVVQVDEYDPG
jgi:hypothetical protein